MYLRHNGTYPAPGQRARSLNNNHAAILRLAKFAIRKNLSHLELRHTLISTGQCGQRTMNKIYACIRSLRFPQGDLT